MKKIFLIFVLIILLGCENKNVGQSISEKTSSKQVDQPDFETIKKFLEEKLNGQILTRNYGQASGNTKIVFENDGKFRGDYFGKKENDGFDGKLSDRASIYYHAQEIHSSKFVGKFVIEKMIDEYSYEMKLENYRIESKPGAHDDIYYNVDFALGLNSDAKYILYRPGIEIDKLDKDDKRLIELAKNGDKKRKKTQGFIIYNKTDKEVFTQNR